ncbi:MAG: carbohydrate ABC transporter permease [Oscillospiraceae bacterium]|nr:carbohydrate ABC transporter permease [Oscillospiraceae bacterium]MDD4545702.1 carbohydrate ABC transporter permease [Oscillospiraceae bacterium]
MLSAVKRKRIRVSKVKRLSRSPVTTFFLAFMLFVVGVFMALPMVYAVVSAFKPMEEFFVFPPRFFVINPTTDNFILMGQLMSSMWVSFERYLFNTLFVSGLSTLIYTFIAVLASYPLAKHRFPGSKVIRELIVTALMFTSAVTGVAQYIILARLRLINTYGALLLPSLASTMGVFLCMQNLTLVPDEMLESGKIDGAGEYRIWWSLVVPNIKPVVATIVIFQFQSVWNQTGHHLIFNEALKPLATALSQITSAGISRAGAGAAASLLLMIPPILVFIISQGKVMETMVNSGIKG